jgi:hypothetical protein
MHYINFTEKILMYVRLADGNNKAFFLNNYFKMYAIERKYGNGNEILSVNNDIYRNGEGEKYI